MNSLGFRPLIDQIISRVVVPMVRLLYGEKHSAKCQTHHSFLIRYSEGEDVDVSTIIAAPANHPQLKDHTDVADITMSILVYFFLFCL